MEKLVNVLLGIAFGTCLASHSRLRGRLGSAAQSDYHVFHRKHWGCKEAEVQTEGFAMVGDGWMDAWRNIYVPKGSFSELAWRNIYVPKGSFAWRNIYVPKGSFSELCHGLLDR
jgi:hypothetical protein